MNPNDNKNRKKRNKNGGGSWRGAVSLVGWALVLTIVVSYASSVMGSTGRQASSVNIEYSQFVEMVEERPGGGREVRRLRAHPPHHPRGGLRLHGGERHGLHQDKGRLHL